MKALKFGVLAALCLPSFLLGACGSDSGSTVGGGNGVFGGSGGMAGSSSGGTAGGVNGGSGGFLDGGSDVITALTIDPPSATLTSTNGSQPTQTFRIVATLQGGGTKDITDADLSLSPLSLGVIDPANGVFTANGIVGGAAVLTATLADNSSVSATANITVTLERTLYAGGAPMDSDTHFGTLVQDASRAAGLVYPLDQAVMPQNVYPADIQWLNGAQNDIFRVRLSKPHATVTAYVLHTGGGFNNDYLVDVAAWRSIAQTDPDDPAAFTIDRWDSAANEAIQAEAPVNVTFAKGALTGSVYYWDIQETRIKRIDDGTGTAVSFMPTPPASAGGGQNCIGCHSVSNSGRYMAGRLGPGNNIGGVFDLTADLTGNPPPSLWPINDGSLKWWDSSWSPDDTRLVVSFQADSTRDIKIYDPFSGTEVSVTGTLPHGLQPSWSPSGSKIAFVSEPDNWGGQLTSGNISLLDVTGPDTFGGVTQIHVGSSLSGQPEGGVADSYPTWTPDSARVVFAHGTGSRSDSPDGKVSALYIMNADGSNVLRLDKACGASLDNFQPNFSPFDEGGYYWVVFLSRRDYGNATAGTRGTQRQQLWVAAIKKDGTTDPSQVPYWLPGQDPQHKNIAAFYAPRACREDGDTCTVNGECCGGDCRPDMSGNLVCAPPPPEKCRKLNETCSTSADCCDERECVNNVCVDQIPK
ncbi:MAG: hypothetical protein R3B07_32545 [Polyangiaceae bacterium]